MKWQLAARHSAAEPVARSSNPFSRALPPLFEQLNPQIPLQLEEIINKCLDKDRNLRYPTAAAVRSDLQQLKRISESGQITSSPALDPTAIPATPPSARSFGWKIAAGAALLVALLGLSRLVLQYAPRPRLDPDGHHRPRGLHQQNRRPHL